MLGPHTLKRGRHGEARKATGSWLHTSSINRGLPRERGPTVHLSCGVCLLAILAACLPAPAPAASLTTAGISGKVFAGAAMESSKTDLTYTSCYCEENVYLLCERLLGRPDRTSATLEVTQGQIFKSQSPIDATRFWWHLYGS